mmetsp:Transcript_95653/g.270749  ORF Transcript_95653/g.270749 Transcript_95653/m.270749 type:complete len:317 (-) Transcript_95653:203-1153(-)
MLVQADPVWVADVEALRLAREDAGQLRGEGGLVVHAADLQHAPPPRGRGRRHPPDQLGDARHLRPGVVALLAGQRGQGGATFRPLVAQRGPAPCPQERGDVAPEHLLALRRHRPLAQGLVRRRDGALRGRHDVPEERPVVLPGLLRPDAGELQLPERLLGRGSLGRGGRPGRGGHGLPGREALVGPVRGDRPLEFLAGADAAEHRLLLPRALRRDPPPDCLHVPAAGLEAPGDPAPHRAREVRQLHVHGALDALLELLLQLQLHVVPRRPGAAQGGGAAAGGGRGLGRVPVQRGPPGTRRLLLVRRSARRKPRRGR